MNQTFTDDVWSLSERFVPCPVSMDGSQMEGSLNLRSVLVIADDPNGNNEYARSIADRAFKVNVPSGLQPQCLYQTCGRPMPNGGIGFEFQSLPPSFKQDVAILILPSFSSKGKFKLY